MAIVYSLTTVLCWGTWLTPIQNVPLRSQNIKTFYIGLVNLVLTLAAALLQGPLNYNLKTFGLPFLGGIVWAISGYCAFTATEKLGLVKAIGIWAPLNIVTSIFWGAILFQELAALSPLKMAALAACVALIIAGVLIIIFARGTGGRVQDSRMLWIGVGGSIAAGILWGSYFILMNLSETSSWVSSFPFSVGMLACSIGLLAVTRTSPLLEKSSTLRISGSAALWGIGNFSMLLLVGLIGAGRGFTISQLAVIVNALLGVYVLKDPAPNTRAAWLTLAGCGLALAAAIGMNSIK